MAYEQEIVFAKELAQEAGKLTRDAFGLGALTTWKDDGTPLTQTDIAINDLVIGDVARVFPQDGVLGEEASARPESDRVWVVDPIDGTQPFSIGIPVSTFCLALVVDQQPVLGVVYDPFQDRLYSAIRNQGAFLNNEPIHVSEAEELAQNYVVLSSRMGRVSRTTGEAYDAIVQEGGKVFNLRSVAYGLMLVASGQSVAAVAGSFGPWDVAAAQVILEEAGAVVSNLNGETVSYNETSAGFVASNGKVHKKVVDLVRL